jgi:multiple antibiotic resistance protein
MEDAKFALMAISTIFFIVDPIAAMPVFLTITRRETAKRKRQIAGHAAIACCALLLFFSLAGTLLFKVFGISMGAFRVAGGTMLFITALDMLRAQTSSTKTTLAEQEESVDQPDVAIMPLALPILCGPGAIATVMVLMDRANWRVVPTLSILVAILGTSAASWLLFRASTWSARILSPTSIRVFERIMGLLLCAVSIEFIAGGMRELFPFLRKL